MKEFGELLRGYREGCNDPKHPRRRLSQGRLGELLGRELDTRGGYSGAAVSDWERGESKIHADQRVVLVSLLKLLHELGGLRTYAEANQLLEVGNYRALNPSEKRKVFLEESLNPAFEDAASKAKDRQGFLTFLLGRAFHESKDELQELLAEAEEGPAPSWPRLLVALLRRSLDRWSLARSIRVLVWLWIWLLSWGLIAPSLSWPFTSQEDAAVAIKVYVGGTLAVPLLIGILINTKNNEFWKAHNLASAPITRLYTYQGASIGFHLGYFGIFAIQLLRYYNHLQSTSWFELIGTGIMLILGNLGARLVPYNLWRAYGRLDLTDGGIFFIFIVLGPLWGLFFFEFYLSLFTSILGGFTILLAITLVVLIMSWRHRRNTVS